MRRSISDPAVELKNCTFIKTVLMLIVVLGHCFDFWTGKWFTANPVFKAPVLGVVADYCNSFHIFAFTLISGYIFAFIKWEKDGYCDFSKFILKKIKRLIIPYFFAAFIWIIPITNIFYDWNLKENIVRFILCTSPAQLWFLWMLFDAFLMAWLLSNALRSDAVASIVAIGSFTIGFVGNRVLPNIFCIWTAFLYFPFFILGMKLREHKTGILRNIPWWIYPVVHAVLFIVCEVLNTKSGTMFILITKAIEVIMHISGALSAFFVLQRVSCFFNWRRSRTVSFFTARSMPMYLFHQQVIYGVIYFLNGKVNPYVNAFANAVVCFSISIAISSILIRYKATRFLVGEK